MPRKANTRAASGAGSIRQRPDGRWEARVTVGNDPGTGKPIRRSIYGNTQKEVLTAMRYAQKAIDDGLYIEPTRLTLAQWLDIWQSDYLLSQKYGTVKTYKAQIATHIKPALERGETHQTHAAYHPGLLQRSARQWPHCSQTGQAGQDYQKGRRRRHGDRTAQRKDCAQCSRRSDKGPFSGRQGGLHRTQSV